MIVVTCPKCKQKCQVLDPQKGSRYRCPNPNCKILMELVAVSQRKEEPPGPFGAWLDRLENLAHKLMGLG